MNYYFYYYFFIIQELLTGRPQEAEARAPSSSSRSEPGSEGLPAEDTCSDLSEVSERSGSLLECSQRTATGSTGCRRGLLTLGGQPLQEGPSFKHPSTRFSFLF